MCVSNILLLCNVLSSVHRRQHLSIPFMQRHGPECVCHGQESLQGFLYYYFMQGGHSNLRRGIQVARLSVCHVCCNILPLLCHLCMARLGSFGSKVPLPAHHARKPCACPSTAVVASAPSHMADTRDIWPPCIWQYNFQAGGGMVDVCRQLWNSSGIAPFSIHKGIRQVHSISQGRVAWLSVYGRTQ